MLLSLASCLCTVYNWTGQVEWRWERKWILCLQITGEGKSPIKHLTLCFAWWDVIRECIADTNIVILNCFLPEFNGTETVFWFDYGQPMFWGWHKQYKRTTWTRSVFGSVNRRALPAEGWYTFYELGNFLFSTFNYE